MTSKPDTGSALQKAMAILEVIAAETHALSVPDIAVRVGLPRQSVHRIVRQMLDEGLLRLDLTRERYGIGPRTEALSTDVLFSTYRRGPVHAVLQELSDQIGETTYVGILKGHEVIHLDGIETKLPLRVQMEGMRQAPAHASALGKLLLAQLPANGRKRFLAAAPLTRYTDNTLTSAEELEREFEIIRQRGYAMSESESVQGVVAAAAPIKSDDGRTLAGIATNAPASRKSRDEMEDCVPLLMAASTRITEIYRLRDGAGPS